MRRPGTAPRARDRRPRLGGRATGPGSRWPAPSRAARPSPDVSRPPARQAHIGVAQVAPPAQPVPVDILGEGAIAALVGRLHDDGQRPGLPKASWWMVILSGIDP